MIFGFIVKKAVGRLKREVFPAISVLARLRAGREKGFVETGLLMSCDERDEIARFVRANYPEWVDSTIGRADKVLAHNISILGRTFNVGVPIDWHRDFESNHRWPLEPSRKVETSLLASGADVKNPWELSRFHHGLCLGKAFAITKKEEYAEEFVSQVFDWVENNPYFTGINWACAMEVAIRAVNLIWTLTLLGGSNALTMEVQRRFARILHLHGFYISWNLERSLRMVDGKAREVNGNHFVCDIVGLLYVAVILNGVPGIKGWLSTALAGLEQIVADQIGEDGVHHELSPNYHRLVLEALLSAAVLLERTGSASPASLHPCLARMVDFVDCYTKPCGMAPLVRDIDSGRFHIFGDEALTDHRHIAEVGRLFLNRGISKEPILFEDSLWLLGTKRYPNLPMKRFAQPAFRRVGSKSFESSGFYIMRNATMYVYAVCASTGMHGFCGHSHNDLLSFELSARGVDYITDSGSDVYTRFPELRNRFRSTSFHNTATIDDQEINRLSAVKMFEIGNEVSPRVIAWKSDCRSDTLVAEYSVVRADAIITHRRTFDFQKSESSLELIDEFKGVGEHGIKLFFHLDTHLSVSWTSDGQLKIAGVGTPALVVTPFLPAGTTTEIQDGWISRTYGTRESRKVVSYSFRGSLPIKFSCLFACS